MLRDRKVYVPRNKKLRAEVIQLHHDMPVGGHRGQWKITKLVTRNFWWPGVTKKVKKYVEGYNVYQRNKNHTEAPAGKLMPNTVLSWLGKIAKSLFIFLFYFFSFLFFYLGLTTQEGVWESVMSQVSHHITSHDVTWWAWESSTQTM